MKDNASEILILHHFSSELPWENAVVDPDRFSTSRNKYTKAEHRESAFPRSFFYVDPKEKEGVVFGQHFTAKVPAKTVYDLRTDPEKFLPKAHSISHLLHSLEEAGYHGARYNNGRDIVTMWKPVPVERVPLVSPEQLSRTPAWSKMTGVQGEGRRSNFSVGNGLKYSAFMHQKAPGHYGFQFGLQEGENQQGITGTGHAKEVFGHVIGLLHQHLRDVEPQTVSFSADSSEPSRVKLYNYLIPRVSRLHPEYEGVKEEPKPGQSLVKYTIKRKENPVQLAATKRNFLHDLAEGYHAKHKDRFGLDIHPTEGKFVFDPDLGKRTAAVFDKMKHSPDHPFVKKAYGQLKAELLAQYHHLAKGGIKFEPWDQAGQPYKDSKDMQSDVLANKRVKYFKTADGFGSDARFNDHPLMEEVPHMPGVKFNDLLRGVHDVLAHAKDGHQFGPKGEFQAWGEHARLFSPLARAALTTETHGQNSWVNFGPHGHKPVTERPFADQKAAVLPKSVTPKLQLAKGDNLYAIYPHGGWIHPEGHIIGNTTEMGHNDGEELDLPDSDDGPLNQAYRHGYIHVALYDNEVHASGTLPAIEKHRSTLKDIARGLRQDGSGKVIYRIPRRFRHLGREPEQLSRPVESDLSQQGTARKKLLLKLLLEAKLKPVSFGGSYALHASGMDAGSYAEIAHNNEPDAVNYVGHYYGLLNGQGSPDLHVFHQNDTGNHSLTVFDSPLPTDKLYEALAPALSSPMVRVIPKDGFNRVAVVNLQNSGILKDANAANTQQFRGDFATLRGRGGEGASAREGHRNAIQAYERQYTDAST